MKKLSVKIINSKIAFVLLGFGILFILGQLQQVSGSNGMESSSVGTIVFSPETFFRQTGAPKIERRNFTTENFSGTFDMLIDNGQDGKNLVSSAIIRLNGSEIFKTNDFNQQVFNLTKSIALQKENLLEVELRGIPNSRLTITILKPDSNPPQASSLSYSDLTPTSVKLSWTKNNDPDFQEYRLYRTIVVNGVPQTTLVATIFDQNATSYTDINLIPDTRYYYRLITIDKTELSSRSNLISIYTPPPLPPLYWIPFANIVIDGNDEDWQGIPAAIIDPIGDKTGIQSGTDISKVYLTHDDSYLYVKIDLVDGPPNPDWTFYSLYLNSNPQSSQIGDRYLLSHYTGTDWLTYLKQWTSFNPPQADTVFQDIAAVGPFFLEMRMPLYQLTNGYFSFYVFSQTDSGLFYFDRTSLIQIQL